jgi:REP element-mobilizing transposase RayT
VSTPTRAIFPGSVVMVTSRTENGLPFTCSAHMLLTIWSFLARAQNFYNITISHFLVMGNHIHLIIYVDNPDSVPSFMEHFKTNIAHVLNRLLGRRKQSLWCESFSAMPILTLEDVVEKIAYIYVNPQKADLVKTIEEYPGASSWQMYRSGELERHLPFLQRNHYLKLRKFAHSRKEQRLIEEELRDKATDSQIFSLKADAWMKAFGITDPEEKALINRRIINRVRELEAVYEKIRTDTKKKVLGADALVDQPLDKPYTPEKFAPHMWCICSDIAIRTRFIRFVKMLKKKAALVRERWKVGDYSIPYPLGLFPPRMPKLGNLMPGIGI